MMQLSVPPVVAQIAGLQKHQRQLVKLSEPFNVDMVIAWAVFDAFMNQLSVPLQMAQTVGPQQHQQRSTKNVARYHESVLQ